MSFYKIQAVVNNWAACRRETVSSLRSCAKELEQSHRKNATEEHKSAVATLAGGMILL